MSSPVSDIFPISFDYCSLDYVKLRITKFGCGSFMFFFTGKTDETEVLGSDVSVSFIGLESVDGVVDAAEFGSLW